MERPYDLKLSADEVYVLQRALSREWNHSGDDWLAVMDLHGRLRGFGDDPSDKLVGRAEQTLYDLKAKKVERQARRAQAFRDYCSRLQEVA